MTMELVQYVGSSIKDVILAQKRENAYHAKAKNTQLQMTFALFAKITLKDAIPVKTQLFALHAFKTISIWIINAENANLSKVAPNVMTKDALNVNKITFSKIMDAWLAKINSIHAWNAQLMMDAPTASMATL